jgi:hypothetical protein
MYTHFADKRQTALAPFARATVLRYRALMATWKGLLLAALFVVIAFAILNPNPFGNNPDIIGDESYFLTSALSAIQNGLPPGWDFPSSGTYYGGPQVYVDTLVLVVVIGVLFIASDFSLIATKLLVALNTGDLLHILRLVNGAIALGALAFMFGYFKKRTIPRPLALSLLLFLFLLLSNVLVIEVLHTAKMWALYVPLVAVPSALFLANEYYLAYFKKPFVSTERYVTLLIWSGVLTFFQSYVAAFSIALLMLYALLLGHISVWDVWRHIKKYWYLIALFAVTQISFMYQAYRIFDQFSGISIRTAEGSVDWFARFYKPLEYTITSQPLSLLYIFGVLAVVYIAVSNKSFFADPRRRIFIAIACVHPMLVYLFFHAGIGFDLLPRYALPLTIAFCFSAVVLLSEIGRRAVLASLACSLALFAVVNVHAITLYWQPSSETILVKTIIEKYNTPDTVFITDHSARRMTLPVNKESLLLLNEKRQDMGRFAFLLEHRDLLPDDAAFKPLTVTAYLDVEKADAIRRFSTTPYSVWMISKDCANMCSAEEIGSGTCFQINTNACGIEPQEVNTLPVFLGVEQLGYSYIVRKIY